MFGPFRFIDICIRERERELSHINAKCQCAPTHIVYIGHAPHEGIYALIASVNANVN